MLPKIEVLLKKKTLVPGLLIDPGMLKNDSNELCLKALLPSNQTYAYLVFSFMNVYQA